MKRTSYSFLLAYCLVALLSCSKGGGGGSTPGGGEVNPPVNPPASKDSIYVSLSTSTVEKNGFDYAAIRVRDKEGKDITSVSLFYIDGISTADSIVVPTTVKDIKITAKKGSLPSNEVILRVKEGAASPFSQKILVEDYTGTWCQYCPRAARILEEYIAKKPGCITVGIHGGFVSVEPFYYAYADNLCKAIGVTGFPWAVINNDKKWNEDPAVLDPYFDKWAPLGLSIQSSVNGTAISGKVSVKYATSTGIPMKIKIMLVEDGLVSPQTNAYNNPNVKPYYGSNPISDFVHANVLRQIAGADIVNGEDVPLAAQQKDNVWTKDFAFTTTGKTARDNPYTIDLSKARIVAFVTYYGKNKFNYTGTVNVQIAKVGETKQFD